MTRKRSKLSSRKGLKRPPPIDAVTLHSKSSKQAVPLSYLVDKHFDWEYNESKCHGAVNALRRHRFLIREFPSFLLLCVKRFRYSELFDETRKLQFAVNVPETVPVLAARYKLLAAVMHHGDTAHVGHYTTLGRNSNSGEWYVFDNDSQPRKTNFGAFTATARFQNDAYIFVLSLDRAPRAAGANVDADANGSDQE